MTSYGITPEYEKEAEKFYKEILGILTASDLPFLIGGTYAVKHYTGIDRPTKDIDIFCKAGDFPKILKLISSAGYKVSVEDERWLSRVYKDSYFIDIIFGSIPAILQITDRWIAHAQPGLVLGYEVKITPPEELIMSKAFRMKRDEFDGADVSHIILKQGNVLDWKNLLNRLDQYWEILLVHILLFRFTYPSERELVPAWLLTELITRLEAQMEIPTPQDKVSRGSILSWHDYKQAVKNWGFKDITEFTFSKS